MSTLARLEKLRAEQTGSGKYTSLRRLALFRAALARALSSTAANGAGTDDSEPGNPAIAAASVSCVAAFIRIDRMVVKGGSDQGLFIF